MVARSAQEVSRVPRMLCHDRPTMPQVCTLLAGGEGTGGVRCAGGPYAGPALIVAAARRYAAREAVRAEGAPDRGRVAAWLRGEGPRSWSRSRPRSGPGTRPGSPPRSPDEVSGRDVRQRLRESRNGLFGGSLNCRGGHLVMRRWTHNDERPPRGCRDGLPPGCPTPVPTPVPVALTRCVDCGAPTGPVPGPAGRTQARVFRPRHRRPTPPGGGDGRVRGPWSRPSTPHPLGAFRGRRRPPRRPPLPHAPGPWRFGLQT